MHRGTPASTGIGGSSGWIPIRTPASSATGTTFLMKYVKLSQISSLLNTRPCDNGSLYVFPAQTPCQFGLVESPSRASYPRALTIRPLDQIPFPMCAYVEYGI